jgi:hypothetical protein
MFVRTKSHMKPCGVRIDLQDYVIGAHLPDRLLQTGFERRQRFRNQGAARRQRDNAIFGHGELPHLSALNIHCHVASNSDVL